MAYRSPFLSKEARAVIAAYPSIPEERKRLISDFIDAMKDLGIWAKLDLLYLLAAPNEASALINWKSPGTLNLTKSGTVTFTPDRQAQGNGTNGCLEAVGYNPSAGGRNLTLNDAMIGLYTRTPASYDGSTSRIALFTGTGRLQRRSDVSNYYTARLNDGTSYQPIVASQVGHFAMIRTGTSVRELFQDGVSLGASTTASTTAANEFTLFGTGTANWSDAGLSLAYAGASIPAADMEQANAIMTEYLRAIGAAS